MKKLSIEIQTFQKIREDEYVYVDTTDIFFDKGIKKRTVKNGARSKNIHCLAHATSRDDYTRKQTSYLGFL